MDTMKSKYRIKRLYRIIFSLFVGAVFCFSAVPSLASDVGDVDFSLIADNSKWFYTFSPLCIKNISDGLNLNTVTSLTSSNLGTGTYAQAVFDGHSCTYSSINTLYPSYLGFIPYGSSASSGDYFITDSSKYYIFEFDIEYGAGSVLYPATTDVRLVFADLYPDSSQQNVILCDSFFYKSYKVSTINPNRFRYSFAVTVNPSFKFNFWGISLPPLNTTSSVKSYGLYFYNTNCQVLTGEQWLLYQLKNPDVHLSETVTDAQDVIVESRSIISNHNQIEQDSLDQLSDTIDDNAIFSLTNFAHKINSIGGNNISFGKSFLDTFYGLNDGFNPWSILLFFILTFVVIRYLYNV